MRIFLPLILLVVSALPVQADTAAGEALAREMLLVAIGGDEEAQRQFVREHYSQRLRDKAGEANLARTLFMVGRDFRSDPAELRLATQQADSDSWKGIATFSNGNRLGIALGLADGRIDTYGLEMVGPAPPSRDDTTPVEKRIADYMESRVKDAGFSGVVLVAQGDELLFERAYGHADLETGRENSADTPFNLGSMNKMFTAVAIGQLVAAGKLHWEDTVGEHLPDFPNETIRNKVTVHQLLTHSSGIGSYWNPAYFDNRKTIDTLPEFLATFVDQPLLFEPGSNAKYSNGGPVVLGLLIEKLSGLDYYEYIQRNVYAPAGMKSSDHYLSSDREAGFAIGYESRDGKLQSTLDGLGLRGSPAGGGYASARDLWRFAKAMRDDLLLPREIRDTLWSSQVVLPGGMHYGYLFGMDEANGSRWTGHNGGSPGVSTEFRYFPQEDITVIVLSNRAQSAMPIAQWLSLLLTQRQH